MHGNRKNLIINDRDVLSELYYVRKMTQNQIASYAGCTNITVQNRMKEFGMKGRKKR